MTNLSYLINTRHVVLQAHGERLGQAGVAHEKPGVLLDGHEKIVAHARPDAAVELEHQGLGRGRDERRDGAVVLVDPLLRSGRSFAARVIGFITSCLTKRLVLLELLRHDRPRVLRIPPVHAVQEPLRVGPDEPVQHVLPVRRVEVRVEARPHGLEV